MCCEAAAAKYYSLVLASVLLLAMLVQAFPVGAQAGAGPFICSPGEKRCTGDELQGCNSEGTGWDIMESCQSGCDNERLKCNPDPVIRVCLPGEKVCIGENLQQCNPEGTGWETAELCSYGCSDNMCNLSPSSYLWVWTVVVMVVIVLLAIAFHEKVF